jgi:hypothetical protein
MWRKVMARHPKPRSDSKAEIPRVDSTIRPPPRAIDDADDLELEDDAATTIAPLRWPEPPKDLAERLQGVRTDGVGLSRSVNASARPRWSWLWRSLGVAVIVGAMLRIVPVRPHYRVARPAAAPRPEPVAVVQRAPIPPPAAPVAPPPPSVPVAPAKPAIDVTSLPKAAPAPAAPRPAPKRIIVVNKATRAPALPPVPAPPAEASPTIDEDAYDAIPTTKCRTCAKAENPY